MRVRVEQTTLPGIGVRHDLLTAKGRRIGVISFRSGRRDFITFDPVDEDSCRESIELNDDEAQALADILGASLILGQLAGIREQAAGLRTEQITITAGSPFVERTLGDTAARSRTGASIVAVLREGGDLAAKRAKIAILGRWRAGLALTPRGEFSIVIAGLAVAAGVATQLAPLSTAYVLITVVLGPLLARLPDAAWFKKLVLPTVPARPPATVPSGQVPSHIRKDREKADRPTG